MYRDGYGIAPIVKMLEGPKEAPMTSAAADLVRAVALNNDANKIAVREAWAVPQLVKLLGPEVSPHFLQFWSLIQTCTRQALCRQLH